MGEEDKEVSHGYARPQTLFNIFQLDGHDAFQPKNQGPFQNAGKLHKPMLSRQAASKQTAPRPWRLPTDAMTPMV